MKQSLSEILNLLKLRGANWSFQIVDREQVRIYSAADRLFCYFVLDGSVEFSSTGETAATAEAGDVTFFHAKVDHLRRSISETSTVACAAINVRWPGGFDARRMPGLVRIDRQNNPLHMQQLGLSPDLTALGPVLTRAVSFMLVCAIRDHPDAENLLREANFRDPIARAVQFMELHPFTRWTVNRLAKKVGLGRSTFAARFHAQIGKPPMEALAVLRMNLAMDLLAQTDLKIAEVAERVGYQSSSAFIRRFIAHFGFPPGQVRQGETTRATSLVRPPPRQ